MPAGRLAGVALGWRPEIAADVLGAPGSVDFLEVVAETCFARKEAWREACALAELKPVVPHGVKLSLGSAEGIDLSRARRLGSLARELGAPAVSEHVSFTRAGGTDIGHLTSLPFTREAVRVVAGNVAAARRVLPDVPLLLENVAWTFRWPEDEMPEAAFYAEVVAATGCDLLLDVANLYANARNSGRDPVAMLLEFPLDAVGMAHVAGGVLDDGFFLDTHAHPVPAAVFSLVEDLLRRTGPLPLVLERDQAFPDFVELRGEVERLRALVRRAPARREAKPPVATAASAGGPSDLAGRQASMARMLTDPGPPAARDAAPFGEGALLRTRAVLRHKRVDDALPLLPRFSAAGVEAREVAFRALAGTPRPPQGAAVLDALRIAEAGAVHPTLGARARRDRLELRSRFVRTAMGAAHQPRRGPFLGRETLPGGGRVWAMKGLGAEAPVRTIERGGRR